MKDGTPKTNSTGFQPRPNLEENAQLCGIVLATLLIFATPLLLRFCKTLKFAATLAFAGTSSPPVQTDFSQYKSEDDLRKEMGWSDRHWRIAKCQGPYAPLYPNRRAYEESKAKVPQGYELTQLMRHAARYPIKSAHRKIVAALKKLKSLPYETNVAIEDYVKRIEAWGDGKAVVDGLTPEGRKVASMFGAEFADRYSHFLSNVQDETPFVRSSGTARAVETVHCFKSGFGSRYSQELLASAPDHVFEAEKRNPANTIGETDCNPFQSDVKNGVHLAQYQNSELGPLLQRLQAYANEGIKLESADVMHLLSLAAYDETGTVKEVDSGVSTLPASWVDAMMHQDAGDEAEMWHRYSYWYDVKKYYYRSLGNPDYKQGGVGWVNELVNRLASRSSAETRQNQDTVQFPVDGKRLFIDFSHDNRMLAILACMGIISRDDPLELDFCAKRERDFDQGRLSPFCMNLVVERWSPRQSWTQRFFSAITTLGRGGASQPEDLVRVLLNDEPITPKHPSCQSSALAGADMCTLSEFLDSQKMAIEGKRFAELCREAKVDHH